MTNLRKFKGWLYAISRRGDQIKFICSTTCDHKSMRNPELTSLGLSQLEFQKITLFLKENKMLYELFFDSMSNQEEIIKSLQQKGYKLKNPKHNPIIRKENNDRKMTKNHSLGRLF